MFLFDSSYIVLLLAAMIIGGATQAYVNAAYRRQSKVALATGMTGAEVARRVLDDAGLFNVGVEAVPGRLTDHYDPRARVLRLSHDVYRSRSVASAGVAAHEAGHAVQHARSFAPAGLRQALVPAANIGSQLAWPLIIVGILIDLSGLVTLGAILFGIAVLFQIVTLPVEFDASRRALGALRTVGAVPEQQVAGARSVLTAAALTYVAATLVSVMYLLYFIGLGRRD